MTTKMFTVETNLQQACFSDAFLRLVVNSKENKNVVQIISNTCHVHKQV